MEPYQELEGKFAKWVGADYAVSCNSGTSALHLALDAIDVNEGDEVIVPNFTMAAVPFAVSYLGAKPVFIDCDDSLNMNPKILAKVINGGTKAVIFVHTYGNKTNLSEVAEICRTKNVPLIEDRAEAPCKSEPLVGVIACYSFYKNKIIHGEEGGMCLTNDVRWANRMNYLKNMAFDTGHTFFHQEIGYNYRMPNAQAKLVIESLAEYDSELNRRLQKAKTIVLEKYKDIPFTSPWIGFIPWVLPALFVSKAARDQFYNEHRDETRLFFQPMTRMCMRSWNTQDVYGKAHDFADRGLYFIL